MGFDSDFLWRPQLEQELPLLPANSFARGFANLYNRDVYFRGLL
jgi:hypothetical protein